MALNPITFTERVVDDFLHYQLTTALRWDPCSAGVGQHSPERGALHPKYCAPHA